MAPSRVAWPQALAGVGFTAQGFDRSLPYRVEAAAAAGRAGFILAGIDPDAPLGGAGSVLGGPAGFEIDRADPALGTPSHAALVASAREFSDAYQGAVEDVTTADSQQGGTASELVRSDVVFFETPAGGAVFSVGSIAWCGALRDAGRGNPRRPHDLERPVPFPRRDAVRRQKPGEADV